MRWAAVRLFGAVVAVMMSLPMSSATAQTVPSPGIAGIAPSNIAITQTAGAASGPCQLPALALTNTRQSTSQSFVLRITVSAPLCNPIEVTAAIYRMPGNGVAWPQELVETKKFTLSGPGVTEVVFTKTREPAQFDVVTGATPQTISPTGQWHGPLLFPLDVETSQQWWGVTVPDPVVPETPLVPVLAVVGLLASFGVVALRKRSSRPTSS